MNQHTRDGALQHAQWQKEQFGIPEYVYQAWRAQRCSAKRRDIPFNFTLHAWYMWWKLELAKIGPHAKRGLRKGQYMMCRYNDTGPYDAANVYAGTPAQNMNDVPDETRQASTRKAIATLAAKGKRRGDHLRVRGDGHPRSKAVMSPLGRFGSGAEAARTYGITRQAVHYKIRDRVKGWRLA